MDAINDPAWFYSSLAQTAAAIVGLIGAVLGSRIIDHIALLRAQRRALDPRVAKTLQVHRERRRQFAADREYIGREIAETEAIIQNGGRERQLMGEQYLMGGGWGGNVGRATNAREFKTALEAELNLLRVLEAAYPAFAGPVLTKQLIECP